MKEILENSNYIPRQDSKEKYKTKIEIPDSFRQSRKSVMMTQFCIYLKRWVNTFRINHIL